MYESHYYTMYFRVKFFTPRVASFWGAHYAIYRDTVFKGGTQQCSWLRPYATRWKVSCSILNEVVGFFN
jgi:hypothetical protein